VGPVQTMTVLPLSSGSACSCVGLDICRCVSVEGARNALAVLDDSKISNVVESLMVGNRRT